MANCDKQLTQPLLEEQLLQIVGQVTLVLIKFRNKIKGYEKHFNYVSGSIDCTSTFTDVI